MVFAFSFAIINSCNSPLDVQANRTKISEIDNGDGKSIISVNTENLAFFIEEPSDDYEQINNKIITITNISLKPYTINSISFKNNTKYLSKSHYPLPITLEPSYLSYISSKMDITVICKPKEPGKYEDEIYINNLKSPTISIKATVQAISIPSLEFKTVPVYKTKNLILSFKNHSNETAVINQIDLSDTKGVFKYAIQNLPKYIQTKETFSMNVSFTPQERIDYTGRITFHIQVNGTIDNECELSGMGG